MIDAATQTPKEGVVRRGAELRTRRASKLVDHYEAFVHNLQMAPTAALGKVQTVGFSACEHGAGTTTVAINIATAAARVIDDEILLMNASLRPSRAYKKISAQSQPGLAELMSLSATMDECIQSSKVDRLSVVNCGRSPRHMSGADASRAESLLETLKDRYRFIFVDLPPVGDSSIAVALAAHLDAVALVVDAEGVRCEAANRGKTRLRNAGANLMGAVMTKRRLHLPGWLYRRL